MSILPDSAIERNDKNGNTENGAHARLTVAQAVGSLCGYCAEEWKDYEYVRAKWRESLHQANQKMFERERAEETGVCTQSELDERHAVEVSWTEINCPASWRAATFGAGLAYGHIRGCSQCSTLVPVLFPREHAVAIFGYDPEGGAE